MIKEIVSKIKSIFKKIFCLEEITLYEYNTNHFKEENCEELLYNLDPELDIVTENLYDNII